MESRQSVKLMEINQQRIEVLNSEIYCLGEKKNNSKFINRLNQVRKSGKKVGIYTTIQDVFKYVLYRMNPRLIIDKSVEYTPALYEFTAVDELEMDDRVAVYTAVFGNYDSIKEPMYINPQCDYFIFTDGEVPKDSIWKKVDYNRFDQLKGMDGYHLSKYIKMFPHIFFENYKYSIWIDGNIQVASDLLPLVKRMGNKDIAMFGNREHDCIYTEARYLVFYHRVEKKSVKKQMDFYKREGFPKHYGMRECSIIIRNHSSKLCKKVMQEWWEQTQLFTMRDQMSLTYVLWKNHLTIDYIKCLGESWRWNPRFIESTHKYTIKAE